MRKHIGSTIALVLGLLSFSRPSSAIPGGVILILGALAFRSAKKRHLCEVKATPIRLVLEVVALVLIAAAVFLQNDALNQIVTDPVQNIVFPLWAFVAYIIIASRKHSIAKRVDGENNND